MKLLLTVLIPIGAVAALGLLQKRRSLVGSTRPEVFKEYANAAEVELLEAR